LDGLGVVFVIAENIFDVGHIFYVLLGVWMGPELIDVVKCDFFELKCFFVELMQIIPHPPRKKHSYQYTHHRHWNQPAGLFFIFFKK